MFRLAALGALVLMCYSLDAPSESLAGGTGSVPMSAPQASTPPLPAIAAFAHAWNSILAYRATVTIFEQKGAQTQNMVFDYNFNAPSTVAVRVVVGANTGARLAWSGGSTVAVRRGTGFLSLFHKTVSVHDPLVTTIRGSTIDQLSFGEILAHTNQRGVLSESPGDVINGSSTDAVTLIPIDPAADAGLTREVMDISKTTHLPMRVLGYDGRMLVRQIDFSIVQLTK